MSKDTTITILKQLEERLSDIMLTFDDTAKKHLAQAKEEEDAKGCTTWAVHNQGYGDAMQCASDMVKISIQQIVDMIEIVEKYCD